MCTLFCALIVCTLVSTSRTDDTTIVAPVIPLFNSSEIEDEFPDWERTHAVTTTTIANSKYGSTTTPGTLSGTNLNDTILADEVTVSPTEEVVGNFQNPANKKYSSTEPIPANEHTRSKPTEQVITVVTMRSKNKYHLLHPISSILANKEKPMSYRHTTTEWTKPIYNNCKCVFGKNHSKHCNNNEKEFTNTKMLSQKAEYYRREQQRRMMETTTSNIKRQLEQSQKLELQRKRMEMESNRFNTILDILNDRK